MSMNFDKPLVTLSDAATIEADKALWEREDYGGVAIDNNRVPLPCVLMIALVVVTAFCITMPIWGQRPTAILYEGYVKSMDLPEVKAIQDDKAAMAKIVQLNADVGTPYDIALLPRHPLSMDDLRIIKPQIEALMTKGVNLREYSVVGNRVVMANFEGHVKADGTPERIQPWWDKGYTIDVFYVSYFFTLVIILTKRLPPSSWQPRLHK